MLTVKLADRPCLFCGAKDDTVLAKSKEEDFQGVVCPKHMIALLKKWEGPNVTAHSGKGEAA
jgi:hypothetical protein